MPDAVALAASTPPPSWAVRRVPTAAEYRGDVILAAVILVGAILSAGLSSIAEVYGDEQSPTWWALIYAVVLAAPLAVRRRWPAPVAVIVSLTYFGAVSLRIPEVFVGNIAMFIALYTVGAWMNNRFHAMVVRVAIIIGMFVWLIVTLLRDTMTQAEEADVAAGLFSPYIAYMLINVMINVLYFGGAYYFGNRTWNAAQQSAVLQQRTADLERERELTAAQAVALDRVRIARELHDVVAHHVSVMGVQAGAARMVLEHSPEEARRLLGGIEESSRDAIRDLRQLLETLRTPENDSEDGSSTLSLDDLPALVAASEQAGLTTSLTVVGDPVSVPSLVAVNLYRIAQESLTNARRHAGPYATADVRVRFDEKFVELEVVNTGRPVAVVRPGLGLVGMRERAFSSGGTIELTPRESGGFRVRAQVPISGEEVADATFTPLSRPESLS